MDDPPKDSRRRRSASFFAAVPNGGGGWLVRKAGREVSFLNQQSIMGGTQTGRRRPGHHHNLEFRLSRYLTAGQGFAVVVGDDQEALEKAISRSLRSTEGVRALSVSGRQDGLRNLVSLLQGSRPPASMTSEVDAMLGEIAAARSATLSMVVVVRDADLCTPDALEQIRIAAESFGSPGVPIRLVLTGGRFLPTLLDLPRLRGLATRVTARFEFAS